MAIGVDSSVRRTPRPVVAVLAAAVWDVSSVAAVFSRYAAWRAAILKRQLALIPRR
jgi:hypothetical protein